MLGGVVSLTTMGVAGRELAGDLTPFQILFWRSLLGAAILAALIQRSAAGWAQLRTDAPGIHLGRNLGHFFGQSCWFYALGVITLAEVFALEFTTPLWVALLAPLVLGERFTAVKGVAAALGFAGVLAITQPFGADLSLGHAVALAAAFGFTVNIIGTKLLSRRDTTLCILFWMTVTQAAFALVSDVVASTAFGVASMPWPTAETAPWLVAIGLCGLSAHYCITNALVLADATVVQPIDFLRLPLVGLVGWSVYDEPVGAAMALGAALILAANLINLQANRRTRAAPAVSETAT